MSYFKDFEKYGKTGQLLKTLAGLNIFDTLFYFLTYLCIFCICKFHYIYFRNLRGYLKSKI